MALADIPADWAPLGERFADLPLRVGYARSGRLVAFHCNPYGQLYWEHDVVSRDVNGEPVTWDTLDLPDWWEADVTRPLWLAGWNTGGANWPADHWLVCDPATGQSWAARAASARAVLERRRRPPPTTGGS